MTLASIQRPVKPQIPFDTIGQNSLCPTPHPLPSQHLPHHMNTRATTPPTLSMPGAISTSTALNVVGRDSPFPAPRPPRPPQHANPSALSKPAVESTPTVMQLDLEPIPPHELAGLISLGEPIAPRSPTHSTGEDPGSEAGSVIIITGMYSSHYLLSEELTLQCNVDSDTVPDTTSIHAVSPEPESTEPLLLTPGMEVEVEEWLKTVGGPWLRHQEEKHGVPADVWLSHLHHLTRQYSKLNVGFNAWNTYQKWWRHHHPEKECARGAEEGMAYTIFISMAY